MIGISLMLYDLAKLTWVFDGEQPESNLDLIDMSLTGRARGPLVNFIIREMACCYGDVDRVRFEEVNKIRERALDLLKEGSLLEEACENIEENKGHCYRASSGEDAARIVGDLVGEGKTVVKSFSWTVEESKLGERLRESNVVLDTAFPKALSYLRIDNGDLRKLIESMGVRIGGEDVLANVGALYRDALYRADVGITGVRAVAADPGAMTFLPDSGIDRLVTMTPEIHVIVAGIEEVVSTYMEAFLVTEFASKYGKMDFSFLGVVGGPSKTGDIEKRVTYGAHGPREFHVILLDDGRSGALDDEKLRVALTCIRVSKLPCFDTWGLWRRIVGLGDEVYGGVRGEGRCPLLT